MKQTLFLLVLLSIAILSAQFSPLQQVYEGERLAFENNSLICQGDTILTCFKEECKTMFSISYDGGETFTNSELVYNQNEWIYYAIDKPEMVMLSDNTIHIFGNSTEGMIRFTSYNLGETFESEVYEDVKKYKVTQSGDDIYIVTNAQDNEERENHIKPGQFETILNNNELSYSDSYNAINRKMITQWNEIESDKKSRNVDEIFELASIYGNHVVADSADIAYIELDDTMYHGFEGNIELVGYDTLNVYSWYPANDEQVQMAITNGVNWFEESTIIAQNIVPKYETAWTEISGEIENNDIFYVEGDLWIQGKVSGKQYWYCNGELRILGDIYYSHTDLGENPDGHYFVSDSLVSFQRPINSTDFIGLSTNKFGNIAYKHFDPVTGEVVNNNSEVDGEVYIYGAIACIAIGDDPLGHDDGHFSFEYQHPHGSTPNFTSISPYTGNDTVYTNIDLHKYVLDGAGLLPPQLSGFGIHGNSPLNGVACGYPYESEEYINSLPNNENYVYPYGTDYPWYNPVWPESVEDIAFERGTSYIRGSLVQRRRGFMHRSGTDPYNHQNNVWDLENHLYDGMHGSTGYEKNWRYDYRQLLFNNYSPISSVTDNQTYTVSKFVDDQWEYLSDLIIDEHFSSRMFISSNGQGVIVLKKNHNNLNYLIYNESSGTSFEGEFNEFNNDIVEIYLIENSCYVLSSSYNPGSDDFLIYLHKLDLNSYSLEEIFSESIPYQQEFLSALEVDANDNPIISLYEEGEGIFIKYDFYEGDFNNQYVWNPDFADMPNSMNLIQAAPGEFKVLLSDGISFANSKLQYAEGTIDLTESDNSELTKPNVTLSNHPNPFNPSTIISFELNTESTENTEIDIYNIKGQRIVTLSAPMESECIEGRQTYSITWNGTDQNNKKVSSGIYYYTLKLDGKVEASRKMVLLK